MASYRLEWRASTKKDLRALPSRDVKRLIAAAEALTVNPFPTGSLKLSGSEHAFRLRVGNYRILYDVFSKILMIEVIRVAHRKDVYKD